MVILRPADSSKVVHHRTLPPSALSIAHCQNERERERERERHSERDKYKYNWDPETDDDT